MGELVWRKNVITCEAVVEEICTYLVMCVRNVNHWCVVEMHYHWRVFYRL
jgi:hypothetical protein